jgi:hypothetical protein
VKILIVTRYLSPYFRCNLQNLDWLQLKSDLCQFLCQERPLLVHNFHPRAASRLGKKDPPFPIIDLSTTDTCKLG